MGRLISDGMSYRNHCMSSGEATSVCIKEHMSPEFVRKCISKCESDFLSPKACPAFPELLNGLN